MKITRRILSIILVATLVFSIFSMNFSANALDSVSGSVFTPIPTTPGERPDVQFYCTEITRVAKAVNSVEPGTTIVKATPSGVPELSGAYASQAYAGETPTATKVTFVSNTVGVTPVLLWCDNETVKFSDMTYDGTTGTYSVEITGGTADAGDALTFTMDYKWTDGNEYQEKCVSYVENITTGGVFTYIECTFMPYSGTRSYYRTSVSAITRLLGKGVYYEQPTTITTSNNDPYKTYGVYNAATANYLSNVASGYNTLIYRDDKNVEANGATKDIYFDNFIPGVPTAHVYVDSSTATTLADINLRMDANTQMLSDRNNNNPYTAVSNMYVYEGIQTNGLAGSSNATAENTLGYVVPAKGNYGVTQQYKNAAMTTITGGAKAYSKIFTKGFTGAVSNIADGATYTITNEYYSYNYVKDDVLIRGNLTTIAKVPTPIVFHIVDKGTLRELVDFVMNSDPDTPAMRNSKKGTNPQAWYYKSGFANFQESYTEALRVLNNSRATQSDVNSAADSLQSAYTSLSFRTADYTEVNQLKEVAEAIVDNAYAYDEEDVALVEEALTYYEKNYNILYQNAVDVMADNLRLAINNAKPHPADYQEVYAAKIAFEALDEELYTEESWQNVLDVIAGIDFGLSILDQEIVDGYAQAILDATAALEIKTAEFDLLIATVKEAELLNGNNYINYETLSKPLTVAKDAIEDDAVNTWPLERQNEVDELNINLRNAIDGLILKDIDKSALKDALNAPLHRNESYYDQALLTSYKALLVEGQFVYDDETLVTILEQPTVDAKTDEIVVAYEALQASYNPPVDLTELEKALIAADEIKIEEYVDGDSLTEFIAAKQSGTEILFGELTAESAETVTAATERLLNSMEALELKPADKTVLNELTLQLAQMLSEELTIVTYIDGVLGEKAVTKYNSNEVLALITSINNLLKEDLTIKDNERIIAFADEIKAKINELDTPKTTEYLDVAIAEYESSDSSLCTENEWSIYTEAYNAAALTEEATQDEINAALTYLVNAKPFFTADKTLLRNALDKAYRLDLTLYEEDAAMTELLSATAEGEEIVNATLENNDENRRLIADSVSRITEAMKNLNLIGGNVYFEANEETTAVVDKDNNIIYGLSDEGLTDIEAYINYGGGSVEYVESDNGFGTGTIVNFVVNGVTVESYTIIIFGDLSGDGVADAYDYSVLTAIINGDIEEGGSAIYLAADLYTDGAVDVFDLAVISSYVNGNSEITQTPETIYFNA